MGLLDRLARQVTREVGKSAGQTLGNALGQMITGQVQSSVNSANTAAQPVQQQYAAAPAVPPRNLKVHFATILDEAFPQYTVKTLAAASDLGFASAMPAKPYDFALLSGGVCRGVIMLTPHNRDRNNAFKNAKAAAEQSGVPFINFYTHYPNEKGYVTNRIRSFIG